MHFGPGGYLPCRPAASFFVRDNAPPHSSCNLRSGAFARRAASFIAVPEGLGLADHCGSPQHCCSPGQHRAVSISLASVSSVAQQFTGADAGNECTSTQCRQRRGTPQALSGNQMTYRISVRQATFWEFTSSSARTRVHFDAKKEFRFVESSVSDFRFADQHPLLADYRFAWKSIFLSSAAAQPRVLLERIDKSIHDASESWRSLATYREPQIALSVLGLGYGSLGSAPAPIADAVTATLSRAGVSFIEIPSRGPLGEFRALIAGRNCVVAESFRIEELPLNKPLQPIARENARSG